MVESECSAKYDVIMFDVDSKDSRIGMSCPPKPFVEPAFLNCVNKCINANGKYSGIDIAGYNYRYTGGIFLLLFYRHIKNIFIL